MAGEWLSFLETVGARAEAGEVRDFGDPAAELKAADGDLLADLSHYGLIALRGADAATFLQGQTTNDVRLVTGQRSQLSGYCSPKGRLLALFRLFRRGDDFYLRLPRELLGPTLKRLQMYVLRSEVVLEEESSLAGLGLAGAQAPERLAALLGAVPERADEAMLIEGISVLRLPGLVPRFELHGAIEPMRDIWERLASATRAVGAPVWDLLAIRAGIPEIHAATREAFVPQMVNLHAIDGVSFRKGCYTGQEVVARMQYLGKLKRRMFLARVAAGEPPRPGDELHAADAEGGQGAGKVVDARPSPDGGYELLAVIAIASVEAGTPIHLREPQGAILAIGSLPYQVDELGQARNG